MKRRLIIFLLAGITFLSTFGGVAALLDSGPNHTQMAPMLVADSGSGSSSTQSDGTTKPSGGGSGGATTNGNSWGG